MVLLLKILLLMGFPLKVVQLMVLLPIFHMQMLLLLKALLLMALQLKALLLNVLLWILLLLNVTLTMVDMQMVLWLKVVSHHLGCFFCFQTQITLLTSSPTQSRCG